MSVVNLGRNKVSDKQVANQEVSDVIKSKAHSQACECINYLRMRGVNVDKQMANKIKQDIICHKEIMEYL